MSKTYQQDRRCAQPGRQLGEVAVPEQVIVPVAEIAASAKEGQLALATETGPPFDSVLLLTEENREGLLDGRPPLPMGADQQYEMCRLFSPLLILAAYATTVVSMTWRHVSGRAAGSP